MNFGAGGRLHCRHARDETRPRQSGASRRRDLCDGGPSRSRSWSSPCSPDAAHAAGTQLDGTSLRWPWALPFVGILLTIATGPLLFPRIWHEHYGKLGFVWSVLTVAPLAAIYGTPTAFAAFVHVMLAEYMSFIVLLFALYVVAGGVLVTGNLRGTPLVNGTILAIGTLSASVVGTTGAAMILIRPLIRANSSRLHNVHVFVFFIFLVANIGGALSPLGDPPLFVGFLHGVDFFWTTRNMWIETALVAGAVLAIFLLLDVWYYRKDRLVTTVGESPADEPRRQRQHQLPADRRDRRRDPDVGDLEAGHQFRGLRHRARTAEPGARRRARAARHPVARAHAERASRGQRLFLGPDQGGGGPVRRHLRLHHSGAGRARCRQGRSVCAGCWRR